LFFSVTMRILLLCNQRSRRLLQSGSAAATNQAANGACRALSLIVVPQSEVVLEELAGVWLTARER